MHPGQILTALIDVHWYSQLAHTVEANRRVIGMALHLRPRKSARGPLFPCVLRSPPPPLSHPPRATASERGRFRRENSSRARIIGGRRASRVRPWLFRAAARESAANYGRVVASSSRIAPGRLPRLGRTRALMTRGAWDTRTVNDRSRMRPPRPNGEKHLRFL